MYNRYIPQPDGSFRKNRIPEQQRIPEQPHPQIPVMPPMPPPASSPITVPEVCSTCPAKNLPGKAGYPRQKAPVQNVGVLHFLKQLLPKDFDAEDLLIILLLLLMTGDSREDQNTALLTLVLYLFL